MGRLKDKVALVTGSSRGIGAAIGALFAREGAKVALHGRDAEALSAVLADIMQAGGEAIDVTADVTKFTDIEGMRRRIERELGAASTRMSIILAKTVSMSRSVPACKISTRCPTERAAVRISRFTARGDGIIGIHENADESGVR